MSDVIYFEVNNWFSGRDYPLLDFFQKNLHKFSNDTWCKDQKLCVVACNIDMSTNWCVTASLDWVKENVPELLSNDTYTYDILIHGFRKSTGKIEDWTETITKKYSDFLRYPNPGDDFVESRFGIAFLDFSEENLGVTWIDYEDTEDDDLDENEQE